VRPRLESRPTGWSDLINIPTRSNAERALVIETRRQAYLRVSALKNVPLTDDFDRAANTTSWLVVKQDRGHSCEQRTVGTIRISIGNFEHGVAATQSYGAFCREINNRLAGARLADVSWVAILPVERHGASRVYLAAIQLVAATADEKGTAFILAATRFEHGCVYLDTGFARIAEPRQHVGMTCCLLALDSRATRSALRRHRRFHRGFADWSRSVLAA
jgi:hypothetical protein